MVRSFRAVEEPVFANNLRMLISADDTGSPLPSFTNPRIMPVLSGVGVAAGVGECVRVVAGVWVACGTEPGPGVGVTVESVVGVVVITGATVGVGFCADVGVGFAAGVVVVAGAGVDSGFVPFISTVTFFVSPFSTASIFQHFP